MLKALIRWLWPQEPPRRIEDTGTAYVTRERFEEEIAKIKKEADWMLEEWYEKFATLHARTAKRQQRANNNNGGGGAVAPVREDSEPSPRPSVLAYRKPWSV